MGTRPGTTLDVYDTSGELDPSEPSEARFIGRDISRGEAVEHELDQFISKRHDRRVAQDGERAEAEAWAESVRRYNDRLQEENRAAWCEYHQGQAARHRATLEALAAEHEAKAMKLLNGTPNGTPKEGDTH